MTGLVLLLVAINIALGVLLLLKINKTDFSFLTTDISNAIRPLAEKIFQIETIMVQKFEGQKEITKLQVSEIIEEKFRKITAEQNQSTQNITDRFSKFQQGISDQLFKMNDKINRDLETKLNEISARVQENLDQGFKKTNETFNSVVERLAKIDEAQKKIESLSNNVVSLQDVLTDKKSRGIFGEVQLQQVLNAVFGERNDKVFQLQYKLPNGTICDSIIFLPQPTGSLVVDSKFPLENFRRMFDTNYTDGERKEFVRDFKLNLKKHIDDIASKYIIRDVTADQAVLFLPAEAIFAELYAYHGDIIEYAHSKKVWITSPTTFMAMITTVQVVLNNIERSKYTNVIHQELNKLADEFGRYRKRWDALAAHIDTVSKDVREIHITTGKITDRFDQISDVKIDKLLE
ncbi:MAG: DNA recombination protein RmuC [Bacteriovorax sp.]